MVIPSTIMIKTGMKKGDRLVWNIKDDKLTVQHVPSNKRAANRHKEPNGKSKLANEIIEKTRELKIQSGKRHADTNSKDSKSQKTSPLEKLRIK